MTPTRALILGLACAAVAAAAFALGMTSPPAAQAARGACADGERAAGCAAGARR